MNVKTLSAGCLLDSAERFCLRAGCSAERVLSILQVARPDGRSTTTAGAVNDDPLQGAGNRRIAKVLEDIPLVVIIHEIKKYFFKTLLHVHGWNRARSRAPAGPSARPSWRMVHGFETTSGRPLPTQQSLGDELIPGGMLA